MGYVLVHYDRKRNVFVDDDWLGYTNVSMPTSNGLHDFTLGPGDAVTPASYTKTVKASHTLQHPLELTFTRTEP